jgi:hypothetical protein
MTMKLNPMEPDAFGPFKFYSPPEDMVGWTLSWRDEWLPGAYADREALVLICGLFLGHSNNGLVDELMELLNERYNIASKGLIRSEDILRHWLPNNSG